MPIGPNGEKRPADGIGCAIAVAKIATGETEKETRDNKRGRKAGGVARKKALSPERRKEIAKLAAEARWSKDGSD